MRILNLVSTGVILIAIFSLYVPWKFVEKS